MATSRPPERGLAQLMVAAIAKDPDGSVVGEASSLGRLVASTQALAAGCPVRCDTH